jgi:uncharacterized repeat protein (TIGR01451 family)
MPFYYPNVGLRSVHGRVLLCCAHFALAGLLCGNPLTTKGPGLISLPLALGFEENRNAIGPIHYLWRNSRVTAAFGERGTVAIRFEGGPDVKLSFIGANRRSAPTGESRFQHKTFYYLGSARDWRVNEHFERVRYPDIYPGIDLVFVTTQGQLEYKFEIARGADPSIIRIRYDGLTPRIVRGGDLEVSQGRFKIVQELPHGFEYRQNHLLRIACHYRVTGQEVSIILAAFDRKGPLVIDPVLFFSTYLGGSGFDAIYGAATDAAGNLYVTGETSSGSLTNPVIPARSTREAFVAKLNSAATQVLYLVYLGGSGGDSGKGIAVDSSGNVYVTGVTASSNFPVTTGALATTPPGFQNGFVVKLSSSGNLQYSTYLGGAGSNFGLSIAVDATGAAYVTGQTESPTFPITAGAFQTAYGGGASDCFVSKLNAAANALVYSTLLGGSALDLCSGIAVDSSGNAYVTGTTYSTNFPTQSALQTSLLGTANGFLTKINPTGSGLVYSTYLGGSVADNGNAVAVDSSGNAYVAGTTSSVDFPTSVGASQTILNGSYNAFVSKISANGASLLYSTFIGGSNSDTATAIALDSSGRALLGGFTSSSNFPTVEPVQSAFQGSFDAFASVVDPLGASLQFSSYFGGSGDDRGYAIALVPPNNLFLAGLAASTNFPTVSAIQPALAVAYDSFLLEVSNAFPIPALSITKTHTGSFAQGQEGAEYTVTVSNAANAAPTNSAVTVTDLLPAGLTLVSLSGSDWSCVTTSCTRSDVLASGASYSPISVTVNVSSSATSPQANQVTVSGGGSVSASATDSTTISRAGAQVTADFNRDGHPDLVWQNNSTSQVIVWYMGGSGGATLLGTHWISQTGEPGWRVVGIADFNGDGIPDVVWENSSSFQVIVWYMGGSDGTTLQSTGWISEGGEPGWQVVAAADFNGDGVPDVVWENSSTYQVIVWYMGGSGGTTMLGANWISQEGEPGWQVVAAADFNGDGVPDIVWENATTSQVIVWYMGGSGGTTMQNANWISEAGEPGWRVAGAADFNLDGVPDIFWENTASGQVTLWYMGGAGGVILESFAWITETGEPGWTVLN